MKTKFPSATYSKKYVMRKSRTFFLLRL